MTKYTFVLFHKDVDKFLSDLQGMGVMDITRKTRAVDDTSRNLFDKLSRYKTVIKKLEKLETEAESKNLKIEKYEGDRENLLETVEKEFAEADHLKEKLRDLRRQFKESEEWGYFEPSDVTKLKEMGLTPHFYCITEKHFENRWEETYPLQIINKNKGKVYFVVISENEENYSFPAQEAHFPQYNTKQIESFEDETQKEAEKNSKLLYSLTGVLQILRKESSLLSEDLELYMTKENSLKGAEDKIVIFQGFAPADQDSQIKAKLNEEAAYYTAEKAQIEDNPPISLKNNSFVKLFEPIGSLYVLPKYNEHDLTPYFAVFYMLFFGFCLGDMGYGLLILLTGLFVTLKAPKLKQIGKLIMLLGVGSLIIPALNGSFFGTKLGDFSWMPAGLKNFFFSDMKMFWFAIIFGLVQIIFGRLLNAYFAIKDKGFLAGLHNIGWSLVIVWLSFAYASSQNSSLNYPKWLTYAGYLGLAFIILFTSDNKNIFKKIFGGVVELYNITGFFGDMLSYIRLFGLGTSGGILGLVVDAIAMQLATVPYIGWGIAVLMLIFGHIFVLLICSIGAFVHPMRLTFVEFYKNAGFEGGGREFRPLKKTNN
ncbi:MAG: hypothetical protein LKI53_07780 [Bacteroidales bacterium]|nr:hypothetical protein [Bacteroidales bacterium]